MSARLLPMAPTQRIVIHLGPHKTGSTTIQRLLSANRARLSPEVSVIGPRDPMLDRLSALARKGRRRPSAEALAARFAAESRRLARSCRHLPAVLVSSEDLLGPLPGRHGVRGLYPAAEQRLAQLEKAFAHDGAEIVFVFYQRPFEDWLGSVQRQLDHGTKPISARSMIPDDDWAPLLARLRAALSRGRLVTIDFAADAGPTRLGTALLDLAGVRAETIARLTWPRPARVARPETLGLSPEAPAPAPSADPGNRRSHRNGAEGA
ncbi:hypothetical protein HMH01_05310 [Halovulum dunhuangense]|uniref:Sulfotransferase family protein n=1 Tax=Halovulum dunhuangense TaxID=1505036 RepID=A0A849L0Q1_9RHOB|nr:hypothetical protein [Halovulum dunhuangense]NNU79856.1 hypothetical protein [Halovulum dunhuangense]